MRSALARSPDDGFAVGRQGNAAGPAAVGRFGAQRLPALAAIQRDGCADMLVSAVAGADDDLRIFPGEGYAFTVGKARPGERARPRRAREVVVTEAVQIPERAQQVRAFGRTDQSQW